jgi:hypothetical protein
MSYNYNPKVENPNKIFYQMESGGFQVPFFFGGSQVPESLGLIEPNHPFNNIHSYKQLVGYGFMKGNQYKRVNRKNHR